MSDATCPRCGYDQQGALDAWRRGVAADGERACCPVRGVCSECGLEFAWGSLLNPLLAVPNWSFEHVRGWVHVPTASWRNGWSSLLARRWWRRVRMEHTIRPWRLLVHWVVWMVVAELGLGVAAAGSAAVLVATGRYTYGAAGWNRFTSSGGDWTTVVWPTVIWPWREYGLGTRRWFETGLDLADFAVIQVLLGVGMGVALLLVPATMKRVRVRRIHLLRGVGHAAPVIGLGVVAWLALDILIGGGSRPSVLNVGLFGAPDRRVMVSAVLWGAVGVCWWRFIRDYLRLPRAGLVAALLFFVALLGAIALCRPVQRVLAWVWEWLAWQWAGLQVQMGW